GPGPAAVVGALDQLPEPAVGLGRVEPVRVGWRPGEVVDLPAAEVRPVHRPAVTAAIRGQCERALACADQHSYTAHGLFLLLFDLFDRAILGKIVRRAETHRPQPSLLHPDDERAPFVVAAGGGGRGLRAVDGAGAPG